jgi:Asp-tRNA(Asn)/Glu-tRNA(Gln) amidotransferase A subunit family amidase
MQGMALKTLARMLESSVGRKALQGQMEKQAGIDRFRALQVETPITPWPKHVAPRGLAAKAAAASLTGPGLTEPATTLDPTLKTVSDFARAYRSGRMDPVTVADRLIQAIEASELKGKPLRAVIKTHTPDIMVQAKASAGRFRKGKPLSLLDGVPVAVKDELDQTGYRTSVGTAIYGIEPAQTDATTVARLRAAGAILFGKTNMHEIGIGVTGANPHFGVCRNPHDTSRHTGGSSSGSAAAVAAGFCPLAIGADGGGSVRIPAALCGVVGLKATFGRISEQGAFPLCWSVAHVGPIGQSVDDVALGYSLMAGRDALDPMTHEQPNVHLQDYLNDHLDGLKVGIYTPWFEHASKDVVKACYRAVEHLEARGAQRVNIQIEGLDAQRVAHAISISSEMLASVYDDWLADPTRFALDTRINLALASLFRSTDYVKAQRVRTLAMNEFNHALNLADVIVTPTTAITAPRIRESALPAGESNLADLTEIMRFVTAGNFTGLPALTVPAGYDSMGLPIGVQLMGRAWDETLLLRLGKVIERAVKRKRPSLHFNLLD